jgi:hypothetical protein
VMIVAVFFLENKIPRSGDSQVCGTIQILGWISIIANV